MLSDDELFDFDRSRLAHWDDAGPFARALSRASDLYRNHLIIAKWIDQWITGLEDMKQDPSLGEGHEDFIQALREIAAHLRQADFLPGGVLYDEFVGH